MVFDGNWVAAYQAYYDSAGKEKEVAESASGKPLFDGGWEYEKYHGRDVDKPVTPRTCPKCQWIRMNDQQAEPDRNNWCEDCKLDLPGPGVGEGHGYNTETAAQTSAFF